MTPQQKEQLKARFFGMHIGCKFEYLGKIHELPSGGIDYCLERPQARLILRPLSSLTGSEMAHLDAISIHCGKNKIAIGYMRFDYLRSINICVPFMGLDPIAEGWAILEEKIPANEAEKAPKEEEI